MTSELIHLKYIADNAQLKVNAAWATYDQRRKDAKKPPKAYHLPKWLVNAIVYHNEALKSYNAALEKAVSQ
jgi:hypothetical protein